jgi:voltage-gated potassium channel
MSLITMTTVGYMEVRPLSYTFPIFNSFLMLFGVGTMFYAISVVTQSIIEVQFGDVFQKRRVRKMIENLKDHYLVCGFGRVGRAAAAELQRSGLPCLVLDRNAEKVDRAIKSGMFAALADSTRDESLLDAGVQRARDLIAALSTDADNLFLILNPEADVVIDAGDHLIVMGGVDNVSGLCKLTSAGVRA